MNDDNTNPRQKPSSAGRLFAQHADITALIAECREAGLQLSEDPLTPEACILAVIQSFIARGWTFEFDHGGVVLYWVYDKAHGRTKKDWGNYGYILHDGTPRAIACACLTAFMSSRHLPAIIDKNGRIYPEHLV